MHYLDILEKLVSFDTTSEYSNLDLIHWVEGYLKGYSLAPVKVYNQNCTKANLYCSIGPKGKKGVIFSGHTDVVPVAGQPWDTHPFTLVKKGSRFFGRGTADMKGFCAVILSLLPEFMHAPLKHPLCLALSYDEEVGCKGAPPMIEQLKEGMLPGSLAIIGEPTEMRAVYAHKGITVLETGITGHEAHSSQPHQGVSAIMVAAQLIHYLYKESLRIEKKGKKFSDMEPPFTTIHVGKINGGTAPNILARNCTFTWDIRHIPEDNPEKIIKKFVSFYEKKILPAMQGVAPDTQIITKVVSSSPSFSPIKENSTIMLLQKITGDTALQALPFATEGGLFQRAGFIPAICGPGSIKQAHKPNEFIEEEQLKKCHASMKTLMQQFL